MLAATRPHSRSRAVALRLVLVSALALLVAPALADHNPPWGPPPPPPFGNSSAWQAGYIEGVNEAMEGRFDNDNSGERAMGYLAGHPVGTRLRQGSMGGWDGLLRVQESSYVAGYAEGVNEGMAGRYDNDNSGIRAFGYIDGYCLAHRIRRGEPVGRLLPVLTSTSWKAGYIEGINEAMVGRWDNDNSGERALGYIHGYMRGRQMAVAQWFYPGDGDPVNLQDTSYLAGWVEGVGEAIAGRYDNDNSGTRAEGYIDGWIMGQRVRRNQFFDGDGRPRRPDDTSYMAGYREGYEECMNGRYDNDNSGTRALGYVDGWVSARMGHPHHDARAATRIASFARLYASGAR